MPKCFGHMLSLSCSRAFVSIEFAELRLPHQKSNVNAFRGVASSALRLSVATKRPRAGEAKNREHEGLVIGYGHLEPSSHRVLVFDIRGPLIVGSTRQECNRRALDVWGESDGWSIRNSTIALFGLTKKRSKRKPSANPISVTLRYVIERLQPFLFQCMGDGVRRRHIVPWHQ
jgi:hypothetical protein